MQAMYNKLLGDLYLAKVNREDDSLNWREWTEANGYDPDDVDRAFDELNEQGLVDAASLGPFMELTTNGVFHVERNRLVDLTIIDREEEVRKTILRELLTIRDKEGPGGYADWESIWQNNGLERDAVGDNLYLLSDAGWLDFMGAAMVRLTPQGVDLARSMGSLDSLRETWKDLHSDGADPHARGHQLERLLKQVTESEGWTAELNVRSSGEENDLIVSKEFAYFLFSCKWEKSKTGTTTIRDLRDRITARPGSMGVLASVAGFTSEAIDWARDRLESGVVLLVGPGDLERVFSGEARLMELLLEKHGALMTRRTIVVN